MAAAASAVLVLLSWHAPATQASAPEVAGRWLAPFSEDGDGDGVGDFDARPPASRDESARLPTAVNMVVLPDGRILYWSQLEGTESVDFSIGFQQPEPARSRSRVLDLSSYLASGTLPPAPAAWSVPSPEDAAGGDLVGSDQRHLPDGRVLAIGGTEWSNEDAGSPAGMGRTELYGLDDARIFDPQTGTWTRTADMHRGRYYPTLITLPDGDLLAYGGVPRLVYNSGAFPGPHPPSYLAPENHRDLEIYDVEAGTWTHDERAQLALPPFARLHLMPNGKLLYSGAGMLFPPGGADTQAASWDHHWWYDPTSGTWQDAGRIPLGVRSSAFSVLLPLQPPYDRAQVLVGGGTAGPWPGSYLATPLTELITWSSDGDALTRDVTPPLTTARWHSSAVVLPSGEVVALSGADKDEVIDPGSGIPVRHAEMWDPATGEWTRLASAARDRTLHNTAVLLRDGSILVGGHSPAPAHYGAHTTNPPPFSNNFKDPSFEIFQPPYLFRGARPTITGLSDDELRATDRLTVASPDAADPTLRVVLSRLPATTHVNDADQRTVAVAHSVAGAHAIEVSIPDRSVLPPGHYYLFLLKDNGQGPTPSVAEIVRIEP